MKSKGLNQLLSNPDFIELDIISSKFNIFTALGVKNYEIRHSKFLSTILNPNETHGLGVEFLLDFLLCLSNVVGVEFNIAELDLDETKIFPEWTPSGKSLFAQNELNNFNIEKDKSNRLDILVEIPKKYESNSFFIIAIEMKWRARQHKGQLDSYSEQLRKHNKKADISAFLTINGEDPEARDENTWKSITYSDVIVPALLNTLRKKTNTISSKVNAVLHDWLEILTDETTKELIGKSAVNGHCEKLVEFQDVIKDNSDYLELRYPLASEYLKSYFKEINDIRGRLLKFFEECVNKEGYPEILSNRSFLRFYPEIQYPAKTCIGGFPSAAKSKNYPLAWEIYVSENGESDQKNETITFKLFLTLAPLSDNYTVQDRERIVYDIRIKLNALANFKFSDSAITSNWSRIVRFNLIKKINKTSEANLNEHVKYLIDEARKCTLLINEEILKSKIGENWHE